MLESEFRNFAKAFREFSEPAIPFQEPYVPDLALCRVHRFADVSRFTVDPAVHTVAYFLHDPPVLQFHQGNVGTDQTQDLCDLFRVFQIYDMILFPPDHFSAHAVAVQDLPDLLRRITLRTGKDQMVFILRVAH